MFKLNLHVTSTAQCKQSTIKTNKLISNNLYFGEKKEPTSEQHSHSGLL